MKFRVNLFVLVCVITCSSCGGSDKHSSPGDNTEIDQVEFQAVACPSRSLHSDVDEKVEAVVRDPHEFRELYLAIDPNNQDEVPYIDFEEKTAIVLHMGRQTSSAPELRMGYVVKSEALITVEYQELEAMSGCEGDSAIMYPYCIIAIDKTDRDIQFKSQVSDECSIPN